MVILSRNLVILGSTYNSYVGLYALVAGFSLDLLHFLAITTESQQAIDVSLFDTIESRESKESMQDLDLDLTLNTTQQFKGKDL